MATTLLVLSLGSLAVLSSWLEIRALLAN